MTIDPNAGGMSNLLQNRLFLQYLSAAGQDIGSGNPIGTNVNAVTQQNIAAQSQAKLNEHYMKMMKDMLSGNVATGAKMTMDEGVTKFQFPHPPKETGGTGGTFMNMGATNPPSGQADTQRNAFLGNILNPSDSQPGVTGADLAGLGPQDVSRALGGALDVQALMSKIPGMQADVAYKQAMTKAALVPKDERTAAIKNFEYAKAEGYAGSFDEWEKDAKTAFQKDYEYDVKAGYKGNFHKWMLERQQSGATRISLGEKVAEKKAMGDLSGQLYFKDPKWTNDIDKHMNSADVQNTIFQADPKDVPKLKAVEKVKFIEAKVIAGGGSIESVKMDKDGKTMIWTVKWPSGDKETIKHGVRD